LWQACDVQAELAFGITAASRPGHERLGVELERLGYRELWINDTRRGDGVATLAEVAPATTSMRFGLGVVALTEHPPSAIRDRLSRAELPLERLTLGVGSGSSASLGLVRGGVAAIRELLPEMPVAVAAIRPRMLRLAGEIADTVIAAWVLPDRLTSVRDRVAEGAQAQGRPIPRLAAYVRTAAGAGARQRLRTEMDRYAAYGPYYARAFAGQPDGLVDVAVESNDPAELAAALAPYRSVFDAVVVRAIPVDDSIDAWLDVAQAATG
jgi:alkanesulfonate monooxygenase SsuD/methylene tetrahydromethanopterin reductase-like flavin-dependent oxidoreductase (luciferase family)